MESIELRTKQLNEAIRRLSTLGLGQLCIDDLRRGIIWQSRDRRIFDVQMGAASPFGINDPESSVVNAARQWLFDLDADIFPYHYIINDALFSNGSVYRMCHVLFVSGNEQDWAYERPLRQGIEDPGTLYHIYCGVWNASANELSDLGLITVRSLGGGLVKLA